MVLTKLITGLIKRDGEKLVEKLKKGKKTKRASKIKQNDVLAFSAVRVFLFLIPGVVMLD